MYNNTMQTAYVGSLVTILILHAIRQQAQVPFQIGQIRTV